MQRNCSPLFHTFATVALSAIHVLFAQSPEVISTPDKTWGTSTVNAAHFGPGDSTLIIGTLYGEIAQIDIRTQTILQTRRIFPSTDPVGMVISPDRSTVAALGGDSAIQWNIASGQVIRSYSAGNRISLNSIGLSEDGTRLIAATSDSRVVVWNYHTGDTIKNILTPFSSVDHAKFANHDSVIYTLIRSKNKIVFWNAITGDSLREYDIGNPIKYTLSHDANLCAKADFYTVKVHSTLSDTTLAQITWDSKGPVSIDFFPDNTKLLVAYTDFSARIYDTQSGAPLREINLFPDSTGAYRPLIRCTVFSEDGKRLLVSYDDYTIRIFDIATTIQIAGLYDSQAYISSMAISPDGSRILTGNAVGLSSLWDAHTGHVTKVFPLCAGIYSASAFLHDGSRMLTAGFNPPTLWDVATGDALRTFTIPPHTFTSASISPDDSLLLVTLTNSKSVLFNINSGDSVMTLTGHTGAVYHGAFSHSGALIATGSGDKTIRLWNAKSGQILDTLTDAKVYDVVDLEFSNDDKYLLAASLDGLRLWDLSTSKTVFTVPGYFLTATFTPDNKKILCCGGTAGLLDVETLTLDRYFISKVFSITRAWLSVGGDTVITSDYGGHLLFYDLDKPKVATITAPSPIHPAGFTAKYTSGCIIVNLRSAFASIRDARIGVFALDGRKVADVDLKSWRNGENIRIPLSPRISQGMYLCRFESPQQKVTSAVWVIQ